MERASPGHYVVGQEAESIVPLMLHWQYGTYPPSDVSDDAWALVAPSLTLIMAEASQRAHRLREVFNGPRWEHLQYLPYDLLRRKWQWSLLTMLRQTLQTNAVQWLVDACSGSIPTAS